jgi:PST family polysaccharide transporter
MMTENNQMPTSSTDEVPDIASRAARSGGAMFIAKTVRFTFLVLVNFILINLLLPADFGMIRYVMLVVGIANLLNEMGLTTAIVQKKSLAPESLWSLFLISTVWGMCLYTAIFLLAPVISRYFATPELVKLLRVGALMIPAAGISAVHRAWLRRRMEYGKLALVEMSASVTAAVFSVSLAFAGFGVWALVAGNLIFEGVITLVLLVICRIPVSALQGFASLRALLFFGIAIVISRLIDYVLCNAPFFLIGKAVGKEGLGLFSVAYDIAVFPQMAINAALSNVLISTFSRIQTDDKKTSAGFHRLVLMGTAGTMPILLVMTVMPYELLQVISILKKSGEWLAAAPLLRWLGAMGIMYVFATFSNAVWLSQGKVKESIGVSVAMCLSIIVAIAFGVHWGVYGICFALFVRSVAVFPFFMYINYRLTRIRVATFAAALVPSLVAGACMAAVLIGIVRLIPGTSPGRDAMVLLSGALAGILVYAGTLGILFPEALRQVSATVKTLLPAFMKARSDVS